MTQRSDKNPPADTGSKPPRAGNRLAQCLLIGAVLVLIVIAAIQFS